MKIKKKLFKQQLKIYMINNYYKINKIKNKIFNYKMI